VPLAVEPAIGRLDLLALSLNAVPPCWKPAVFAVAQGRKRLGRCAKSIPNWDAAEGPPGLSYRTSLPANMTRKAGFSLRPAQGSYQAPAARPAKNARFARLAMSTTNPSWKKTREKVAATY
jgi:hypothetical protein